MVTTPDQYLIFQLLFEQSPAMMASSQHTGPLQEVTPSPINKIPTELLHEMFTHLSPTEAANLRLISKKFAKIGIEFILPELHPIVKKDGFDNMLAIVEHPVIPKYVKSLYYEVDVLNNLDFEEWRSSISKDTWSTNRTGMAKPEENASPASREVYERNLSESRMNTTRNTRNMSRSNRTFSPASTLTCL